MRSEDVISRLAGELRPVRRVADPLALAMVWLALAVAVIGLVVLATGPRAALLTRSATSDRAVPLLAAVATGLLASFAAFQLAVSNRDGRWGLLLLPAALAWLASMDWGCRADLLWVRRAALLIGTRSSYSGYSGFVPLPGLPLAVCIAIMTRSAAAVHLGPVAALGGLSAAGMASIGQSCVHQLDTALMVVACTARL